MKADALETSAMARVRSPNYPKLSLPEAIQRVKAIHAAEQHLAAPKEVIAKHLGYNGLNGASLGIISAIGKYGLLEEANGDKMKVSPLAVAILYPSKPEEKTKAIKEAAFKPPLFAEIAAEWQGAQPSDENLRSYLVRKNFATDALDRVIEAYRETMDLVTRESGAYPPAPGGQPSFEQERDRMTPSTQRQPPASGMPPSGGGEPFRLSIIGNHIDLVARLETPEQIDELMHKLKFAKLMITPVGGPMATEYEDSEEGREARRRDDERRQILRDRE